MSQKENVIVEDIVGKTNDAVSRLFNPAQIQEWIVLLQRLFYTKNFPSIYDEKELINTIQKVLVGKLELYCNETINQQEVVQEFIYTLSEISSLVMSDIKAAYEGDPAADSISEIIAAYPGPFAIMVQRVAHKLYELDISILPRVMTEYAHSITGIDIHPGANIGESFFIDHGTGVVIGETTVIGNHVKIYQGVTLGALSTSGGQKLRKCKRHPSVQDNVTIYAGASVLGGDTVIGAYSIIGSNAFITESVPAYTRVSPARERRQYIYKNIEKNIKL